ncbi:hypothetical protein [Arsenophonus endosymbiont of Crataerina pallida]|uniref:hypothetical protein n=1 Tax=Arsenophonus endosymbiont of Crataerina pallida TaxID=3066235 RepID=UPI0030CA8FEE
MLSRLIRILFALTAIAPLSISLTYVFVTSNKFQFAVIALVACLILGLTAIVVVNRARAHLECLPISIKKAKSADKEVIGFFTAYVLPLVFKGVSAPDLGAWAMAAVMLLFVLWSTHAFQVNPVLGLFGYHFYEVETADGITYLMITKRKINDITTVNYVVQLGEHGVLDFSVAN